MDENMLPENIEAIPLVKDGEIHEGDFELHEIFITGILGFTYRDIDLDTISVMTNRSVTGGFWAQCSKNRYKVFITSPEMQQLLHCFWMNVIQQGRIWMQINDIDFGKGPRPSTLYGIEPTHLFTSPDPTPASVYVTRFHPSSPYLDAELNGGFYCNIPVANELVLKFSECPVFLTGNRYFQYVAIRTSLPQSPESEHDWHWHMEGSLFRNIAIFAMKVFRILAPLHAAGIVHSNLSLRSISMVHTEGQDYALMLHDWDYCRREFNPFPGLDPDREESLLPPTGFYGDWTYDRQLDTWAVAHMIIVLCLGISHDDLDEMVEDQTIGEPNYDLFETIIDERIQSPPLQHLLRNMMGHNPAARWGAATSLEFLANNLQAFA